MDQYIIFDGPTTSEERNGREIKLEHLIKSAHREAKIDLPHSNNINELIQTLVSKTATVCLLHHSELRLAGLQSKDCPPHHFYIHYSGAGFETGPEEWQNLDHHVFLVESIDSQGSSAFEALYELIKALKAIQPAPPCGQWEPQLKTLALTPYKSPRQFLYGNFPNWLAQAWRFQSHTSKIERQVFNIWAQTQKLPDGSGPGPLTIEAAYKIVHSLASGKGETMQNPYDQQHAKIRHDFKYLLFALKDGDTDRFRQLWNSNFVPDLHAWLQHNQLTRESIGMDAVEAWLNSRSVDFLEGKKLVQNMRDLMDHQTSKTKKQEANNQESTKPKHEGEVPRPRGFQESTYSQEQASPHSTTILPRHQELPYAPTIHSPRLWCVGPHPDTAKTWFNALQGLKAGHRPLNLSQCCYDEHGQLGDLIHQLRQTNPRELYHTLLLVDVGQQLREALNAGRSLRSLSASAPWTHDSQLQLGILVRLICTFPHMGLVVLHDLEATEVREVLNQELLLALPQHFKNREKFLEQIISQHFFNITQDSSACAKVCANFMEGQRTLFDPTGLRTLVKLRLIANIFSGATELGQPELQHTEKQRQVLASRLEQVMISIDEDASSTLFHAYAGYRYGYRAWTVTSFYQFDQPHIWDSTAERHLVIRDTDLRFPDIDGREGLREVKNNGATTQHHQPSDKKQGSVRQRLESVYSDLWQYLPKVGNAPAQPKLGQHWKVRAVAATGQPIRNKPWLGSSEKEIRLGEIQGQTDQVCVLGLSKPLRSLYDLSQLMDRPDAKPLSTIASRLIPPARLNSEAGHFAPYINLPLAGELLVQAKSLQGEDELDWLIGAILAIEADEILLGMSEYTGLDAVRWLHRCEVRAEIRSVGFSGLIHIQPRKKELQGLVQSRYRDNSLSQDHFLSRLWDDLRTLYKGAEQFHASEEANVESFCKRKWMGHHHFGHRIEEVIRRIVILSASSIWAWSTCLFISTLLFWLLYGTCLPSEAVFTPTFGFKVFISSLMGEPALGLSDIFPQVYPASLQAVLILHLSTSYLLFGFFLSMVYRRITRS